MYTAGAESRQSISVETEEKDSLEYLSVLYISYEAIQKHYILLLGKQWFCLKGI